MSALLSPGGRITGAVLSGDEILCFDVTDYYLEPGTEAVVVYPTGAIEVHTIVSCAGGSNPDGFRRRDPRFCMVRYVSGHNASGVPESIEARVLGRLIARHRRPARARRSAEEYA